MSSLSTDTTPPEEVDVGANIPTAAEIQKEVFERILSQIHAAILQRRNAGARFLFLTSLPDEYVRNELVEKRGFSVITGKHAAIIEW